MKLSLIHILGGQAPAHGEAETQEKPKRKAKAMRLAEAEHATGTDPSLSLIHILAWVVAHEALKPLPADAALPPAADHRAIPHAAARGAPVDEPYVQALLLGVHAEPARRFEPCLSTAGAARAQSGRRGGRPHAPLYRFHNVRCLPLR